MKNKFYMLAGLPGCGKTTLTEKLKTESEREVVVVSSDKIRCELYGSEDEQGKPDEVFKIMAQRTQEGLAAGKDVIYDACNINSKKRRGFLTNLSKFKGEKICIICATPYEECLRRNRSRQRNVPAHVIKRMYLTWNSPYYFEGWDKILIHFSENAAGSLGTPKAYAEQQMDFQQENPYHLETLGVHMKEALRYLLANQMCEEDSNLAVAALIHDCGKPFTKAFSDMKGNTTEIAHYYLHQCTGAYDAMFFEYQDKSTEDILEIATLINLHMVPLGWNSAKTAEGVRRIWGEELYQSVLKLNEADKASSVKDELYFQQQ